MSKLDLLKQLNNHLVSFLDELIETFPQEPDFIIFRILVKDKLDTEDIMNYIVNRLCPLQDMVKNKNESFFLDNNILFENLDKKNNDKVNRFKKIWISGNLDGENKDILWSWFASIISLGKRYTEIMTKQQ
jgi:hypothetical protein